MKDNGESAQRGNKNLLDCLFHPLTTIRLHCILISYHLFYSNLKCLRWRGFPWDIIHSLIDLSMWKHFLIHNTHVSLWNFIPLLPGTHPKSIFLFPPLFVTFNLGNAPFLLPFNNPAIRKRFNLFQAHKSASQHLCCWCLPLTMFHTFRARGAGSERPWLHAPQPWFITMTLAGLRVLHLADVSCSFAQCVVRGCKPVCKSLIALSYLKWIYRPRSDLGRQRTVQWGMKSTFSSHAFCSKAGRWQCILRN